ncbi:MAG: MFS transporter [Candidatus Actinomarina sp.]|tara:strand:- start:33 stop:1346 length:1314 start_codon:yes stop_codon:yes gene_type:complete
MNEKNNKRTIFGWAMYDWANSAYSTTTVGALMPAYFAAVVVGEDGWNFGSTNYLADEIWGYATGIVIFIFFLIMPIFGAMADMSGSKMKFLKIFAYGGSVFATVMFFLTAGDVWLTLFLYLGAQFGFVGSLVFNDGLLRDITTEETIDQVSTRGYALGYIGGGLQLVFAFVIVLFGPDLLGIDTGFATRIAIATAGIWWAGFSYFSFSRINVEESAKELEPGVTYLNAGWNSVRNTLKKVRKFPQLLTFLIAYMFYWDGAQTIINMAGVFSVSVLKLTTQDVLIVFVIVQFVAFLGAVIAGRVAKSIGPKKTVLGCIVLFFLAGNGGAFLPEQQLLPVIGLGTIIGLGMGGIQALSRSMYAMMIPDNAQSEFMGFFSVISKFAAMWGPVIYAAVSQSTGSGRNSLQVISIVFVIGFILLWRTDPENVRISEEEWAAS